MNKATCHCGLTEEEDNAHEKRITARYKLQLKGEIQRIQNNDKLQEWTKKKMIEEAIKEFRQRTEDKCARDYEQRHRHQPPPML